VHGEAALQAARRISQSLFSGGVDALTESDFEQLAQDGVPGVTLDRTASGLIESLVAAGLARSNGEARGFLRNGSVTVNGVRVEALDHRIAEAERRFGRFTLLRRGKKNYALVGWR
jgi:tyrosyl-tRNA synthetase